MKLIIVGGVAQLRYRLAALGGGEPRQAREQSRGGLIIR
jgi:hypothetical protein